MKAAMPFASFALAALGAHADNTERRTFDVALGGRLLVDADRGVIEVSTGAAGEKLELVVEGADKVDLEYELEDDTTIVRSRTKSDCDMWSARESCRGIKFSLTIPKQHDVDLTTRGGSITLGDLAGRADARTAGGRIAFGDIAGPADAHTSGGSIRMGAVGGKVSAKTSGGTIEIGDVEGSVRATTSGGSVRIGQAAGAVDAKTSGGSIRIAGASGTVQARTSGGSIRLALLAQPTEDSHLRTSGGNIEVGLAASVGVRVEARTSGGRVVANLPVEQAEVERQSLRGNVNGGGPLLALRTSGGSIRLTEL